MFNNIEKNLYERIGTGLFVALFVAFLFTVLFQSYVYQYKSAFVADQEINMVACLTEIMATCKFK